MVFAGWKMVRPRFNRDENQDEVPMDELRRGDGTYALVRAMNRMKD